MRVRRFFGPSLVPVVLGYLITASATPTKDAFKTIISWKALDFSYEFQSIREYAISEGNFIPGNPVPIDIDVYRKDNTSTTLFVTIPRFRDGVPVTLGYVTNHKTLEGNHKIAPYPSWAYQNPNDNCGTFISVYRIHIDRCGRLWVLDTGKLGGRRVCPPRLFMFSLENNELQSKYVFPAGQYTDSSLFVTPVVDIRGGEGRCLDTYVYIADVTGFSMIVYDHRKSRSWKIVNNLFYPYPPHGTFTINNESFDLMDGILGLALGPITPYGDRNLYFHSLASRIEAWVPTSIIRNSSIFEHDMEASARSFRPFARERSSQSAAEAMDKNGVLFFGLMSDTAIGCWNSVKYPEFGKIEKIAVNKQTLQFVSGMKIVTSKTGHQELWIMSSPFQKVMTGSMDSSETNFRIQVAKVDDLIRGTRCDVMALGWATQR